MERHLVVVSSLDFSPEQVLVQMCAGLGMVELDLASSQGTAKTSVMSHHNHEHPLSLQTLPWILKGE